MGAQLFLVFIGLRFELSEQESEELEANEYSLALKADEIGLDTAEIRFEDPFLRKRITYLFIGTSLGLFGAEYLKDKPVEIEFLVEKEHETKAKLKAVEMRGNPQLWIQWRPDY